MTRSKPRSSTSGPGCTETVEIFLDLPALGHSRIRVANTLFALAARFLTEGWLPGGIWGGEVLNGDRRVAYWTVHPNGREQ
jgi:hypothetical protein